MTVLPGVSSPDGAAAAWRSRLAEWRKLGGFRYWLPYWTYHFTRHPRKTAPVFGRWLRGKA